MPISVNITKDYLSKLKASGKDELHRDKKLTGFGVKVTKGGTLSFFAEGRVRGGRTRRITLGRYPALPLVDARRAAQEKLSLIQQGIDPVLKKKGDQARSAALTKTLSNVFEEYLLLKDLKTSTQRDYRGTMNLVYGDWLSRPISEITRAEVVTRFTLTRDTKGLATAGKSSRILSALFNFSMADEFEGEQLIKSNPVDVLRQKKINRVPKRRETYLSENAVAAIIQFYENIKDWPSLEDTGGVTKQGICFVMLLLTTGLRRSEAQSLRWENVDFNKKIIKIDKTKNDRVHFIPFSTWTSLVLENQQQVSRKSVWVFPANSRSGHLEEPKFQLARIAQQTNVKFTCHDLRRTFASHAYAQGVTEEDIARALNHKRENVTASYIFAKAETLRPVFQAVADGYFKYAYPDFEIEEAIEEEYAQALEAGREKNEQPVNVFSNMSGIVGEI